MEKIKKIFVQFFRLLVYGEVHQLNRNEYVEGVSLFYKAFTILSIFNNILYIILITLYSKNYNGIIYLSTFFLIYIFILKSKLYKYYITNSLLILSVMINLFIFYYLNNFTQEIIYWGLILPFFIIPIKGLKSGILWNIIFVILNFIILHFFSNNFSIHSQIIIFYIITYLLILSYSIIHHISKERQLNTFEYKMYHDQLTNLRNRRQLLLDLKHREKNISFLILINIDGFKEINNFFGHIIGDRILFELGQILRNSVAKHKTKVYKLHADEYSIIFYEEKSKDEISNYIKELYNFIDKYKFNILGHEIPVNVSFGIVSSEINGYLIEKADIALKLAKSKKIPYYFYDKSLNIVKQYESNLAWAKVVKNALQNNRIVPYFQGIINNKTGKIEKFESLARLIDEKGKIVSPFFFINVAKKIKLYDEITKIMIKKSFDFFRYKDKYSFSINLLPYDLMSSNIITFLKNQIDEFPDPSRIILEIVESEEIDNYEYIKDILKSFRDLNVKIAIDDFGTGYSSFYQVLKLDADIIKIDGSLIKFIHEDENVKLVVKNIVNFAKELNKTVVAEFVHCKEVYNTINELGVDYSQGFYFSEPKPEIEEEQ